MDNSSPFKRRKTKSVFFEGVLNVEFSMFPSSFSLLFFFLKVNEIFIAVNMFNICWSGGRKDVNVRNSFELGSNQVLPVKDVLLF